MASATALRSLGAPTTRQLVGAGAERRLLVWRATLAVDGLGTVLAQVAEPSELLAQCEHGVLHGEGRALDRECDGRAVAPDDAIQPPITGPFDPALHRRQTHLNSRATARSEWPARTRATIARRRASRETF